MKILILLSLLASGAGFGDTLLLEPGETRILRPGIETTVVCQLPEDTLLEKFCNCLDAGPHFMVNLEKHFIFSDGRLTKVFLGRYQSLSMCEEAKSKSPACK